MTIKEVEQILEVPRATIRFYEKEGLIDPKREGNRYRDYSEEDVEQLKRIIILRKAGLPLSDISDLFDGAESIDSVLTDNLLSLQKQMEELKGSINLCRKIKEDAPEISSFNPEIYWNYIEEEEKKGNAFVNIAKELAHEEKKILARHLGWNLDRDGNIYDIKQIPFATIIVFAVVGAVYCFADNKWSIDGWVKAVKFIVQMILFETVFMIPIYFLGKKHPGIAKKPGKYMLLAMLVFVLIIFVLTASVG